MSKVIDKNGYLSVGKYKAIFSCAIFTEQIAWLLDELKGLVEKTYEFVEGKPIRIISVYSEIQGNENKLVIEFELLNNPVPVAVIIAGIIGLLGIVGTLLVLDKIEQISETPLGTGVGLSLGVGSIILIVGGGYFLFKYLKQ